MEVERGGEEEGEGDVSGSELGSKYLELKLLLRMPFPNVPDLWNRVYRSS